MSHDGGRERVELGGELIPGAVESLAGGAALEGVALANEVARLLGEREAVTAGFLEIARDHVPEGADPDEPVELSVPIGRRSQLKSAIDFSPRLSVKDKDPVVTMLVRPHAPESAVKWVNPATYAELTAHFGSPGAPKITGCWIYFTAEGEDGRETIVAPTRFCDSMDPRADNVPVNNGYVDDPSYDPEYDADADFSAMAAADNVTDAEAYESLVRGAKHSERAAEALELLREALRRAA